MPQTVLHEGRQTIQAAPHVHRRHGNPNLRWITDQARHRNNSATQRADTEAGSAKR